MNRLLKGAIAGAAGVALLLGGAGTFALWNSTATVTGGKIVAGNLKVTSSAAIGTWESTAGPISNINAYRIVPGDVLTYTKNISTTATGDNLKATLGIDPASIKAVTSASPTVQAANDALAGYLAGNAVVAATGTGVTGSNPTYSIPLGTTPVVVTVTITFPAGGTGGAENGAKLGSVSLDDLAVTLNQVL